jgi:hypothetical protein
LLLLLLLHQPLLLMLLLHKALLHCCLLLLLLQEEGIPSQGQQPIIIACWLAIQPGHGLPLQQRPRTHAWGCTQAGHTCSVQQASVPHLQPRG